MRSKLLILGHRGASALAPENTIAAFSRAMSDGADGIEFDVRLSRDKVPVVIHDGSLKRTGLRPGLVSEMTATELETTDVGSWFSSKNPAASYAGEHLPTLAQVFDFFSPISGQLYIELKCDSDEGAELAFQVVQLIRSHRMAERSVVESFDLSAIRHVKSIDPEIRTAALFEPKLSRPISTIRRLRMIDQALENHADEIALHYTLAGKAVVEKALQKGLEVVLWTVNDLNWIERAQSMGVKALITNNPAIMRNK